MIDKKNYGFEFNASCWNDQRLLFSGRAVASDTSEPWFESRPFHISMIILNN